MWGRGSTGNSERSLEGRRGERIGRRVTSAEEMQEIRDAHEWEQFPFEHEFEGQGRFVILRAEPKGDYDEANVWMLTVRPISSGPPREDG